ILYTVWVSFHSWNLVSPKRFVGLDNYQRAFDDVLFRQALQRTVTYTLIVVFATLVLGLFLAVLLDQNLRGRAIYRAAFFSPVLLGSVVVALIWHTIFNPSFGPLAVLTESFGGEFPPVLARPDLALYGVAAVSIWQEVGFYMVIFLAGLQAIPPHVHEAAMVDGAGSWKRFRDITLPLLRPTTLFVIVTSFIGSLQVFGQVYVMTRGGPAEATTVAVYYIYRTAFYFQEMGYGSALAVILFLGILAVTIVNLKFFRAETYA
ncbi:MAG: carbohydrate ABC transporter permease, partial [Thermomicrobiales bacterium]